MAGDKKDKSGDKTLAKKTDLPEPEEADTFEVGNRRDCR